MRLVKVAFKYLKRYPRLAILSLFFIIMASLFEGISFGMLIPLIQSMTNAGSNILEKLPFARSLISGFSFSDQHAFITVILLALFAAIVAKNVFLYMAGITTARLRFGLSRDLSIELMGNVIEYDLKFFDNSKSGYIISNLSNETKRMGDFLLAVLQAITAASRVASFVILLFFISVKASVAVLFLIAVVLLPLEIIMKKLKTLSWAFSRALSDYTVKLTEILSGIRLIKVSATEDTEKEAFKKESVNLYVTQFNTNKYLHLLVPLSEIMIFGLIVLCFSALMRFVKIDIAAAFPFFATYLLILARALTQLNLLNSLRSNAISNMAAFDIYENINDPAGKLTIRSGVVSHGEFRSSIEFKNVRFSYDGVKPVLEDINIVIPKGGITAFVGVSGSGKSTLVNLMLRFYDPTTGSITVDSVNIKELDLKRWRRRIGFVSQDPFIFNANLRYNILYGHSGVSDEAIMNAAKTANAHEFITELSDKYNTILGERGVKLSGGQKQRISIARAIIHNPEILILDEATSSLDSETERLISEAIDRLTRGRTVVAIAHRLSTVAHADNIIVLNEGRILESGTHTQLIKKEGFYKRLCDAQFNLQPARQ